jgi:ribosomal-protein-alanine N-acetyltransferase
MDGGNGTAGARSRCERRLTPASAAVGRTGIAIESARTSDILALVELDRTCFGRRAWRPGAWVEVVTDPGWTTLVIRDQGAAVAAAVLLQLPPGAHLASIGVHPDHRGRGIGGALLREAVARSRRAKARFLSLEVDLANGAAQRLYRREGFGLVGRFREDGRWRIAMHRRLGRHDGS